MAATTTCVSFSFFTLPCTFVACIQGGKPGTNTSGAARRKVGAADGCCKNKEVYLAETSPKREGKQEERVVRVCTCVFHHTRASSIRTQ